MLVARYFLNPKSKIEGLVSGLWLLLDLGFGSFSSSTPYRMMLRKCTSFDYEDDDEDDMIKSKIQNPKSKIRNRKARNPKPRSVDALNAIHPAGDFRHANSVFFILDNHMPPGNQGIIS